MLITHSRSKTVYVATPTNVTVRAENGTEFLNPYTYVNLDFNQVWCVHN